MFSFDNHNVSSLQDGTSTGEEEEHEKNPEKIKEKQADRLLPINTQQHSEVSSANMLKTVATANAALENEAKLQAE